VRRQSGAATALWIEVLSAHIYDCHFSGSAFDECPKINPKRRRRSALPAHSTSEFDDDAGRRENRQNTIELAEHAPIKTEEIESYKALILAIQQVQNFAC
jgi:hypothetical protein